MTHRYWFRPKRYGYGATPATWEGWAAAAAMVLVVLLETSLLPPRLGNGFTVAVLVATIAGFVIICRLKTDGSWRWRWE